jgi:hypothetical protein
MHFIAVREYRAIGVPVRDALDSAGTARVRTGVAASPSRREPVWICPVQRALLLPVHPCWRGCRAIVLAAVPARVRRPAQDSARFRALCGREIRLGCRVLRIGRLHCSGLWGKLISAPRSADTWSCGLREPDGAAVAQLASQPAISPCAASPPPWAPSCSGSPSPGAGSRTRCFRRALPPHAGCRSGRPPETPVTLGITGLPGLWRAWVELVASRHTRARAWRAGGYLSAPHAPVGCAAEPGIRPGRPAGRRRGSHGRRCVQ